MRVNVDFSIFTGENSDAFGMATDAFELDCLPKVGDCIDVLQRKSLPRKVVGFTGLLKVGTVVSPSETMTLAVLEDVFIASRDDAFFLAEFLEHACGMFVTVWERDAAGGHSKT
jgi:hypothetical protein